MNPHTTRSFYEYPYGTDSELGTIEAESFAAACAQLDAMLTEEALEEGAWGWVKDVDGRRYQVGDCYEAGR